MIIVTGSVNSTADTEEEVRRLCLEHVIRSRQEPGCLLHSVHRDVENPSRLTFLEHWTDLDALRVHFAVPACRAFAKTLRALASESSAIEIYEAVLVEV